MKSIAIKSFLGLLLITATSSCDEFLNPEPVDLLIDNLALNEPGDVASVEIGLYSRARSLGAPGVIAGDMTSDLLIHNGTFNQYRELGNKEITSSNASASSLWGAIYGTVYVSNFILERLPEILGVPSATRDNVLATARFWRGYAYFVAVTTFGDVPLVVNTDIEVNRNIPRTPITDMLNFILEDYQFALANFNQEPVNAGFVGTQATEAALARYYLYVGNWSEAERYATGLIESDEYELVDDYLELVLEDFTDEAILEFGYSIADDPGTDANFGLNDLFIGRREIIPSNQTIFALNTEQSGDRWQSIRFDIENLVGDDNGWSVAKYGTADEDNNNIVVFRLGEMYLIRAEARAQQNRLVGDGSAEEDINVLRTRANAPTLSGITTQQQMLLTIENESLYELAYEGSRWYHLVRTDRAATVMRAYTPNWKDAYEKWPVPLREIQNNPALAGNQNPGY